MHISSAILSFGFNYCTGKHPFEAEERSELAQARPQAVTGQAREACGGVHKQRQNIQVELHLSCLLIANRLTVTYLNTFAFTKGQIKVQCEKGVLKCVTIVMNLLHATTFQPYLHVHLLMLFIRHSCKVVVVSTS